MCRYRAGDRPVAFLLRPSTSQPTKRIAGDLALVAFDIGELLEREELGPAADPAALVEARWGDENSGATYSERIAEIAAPSVVARRTAGVYDG